MESQKMEQCLYLDNVLDIAELEKNIIDYFAREQSIILEHFNNAKIISRQASQSGYYAKIHTISTSQKIQSNGFSESVDLFLDKQLIGGAMIFIENGLLAMIECYCWEDNDIFITLKSTNG